MKSQTITMKIDLMSGTIEYYCKQKDNLLNSNHIYYRQNLFFVKTAVMITKGYRRNPEILFFTVNIWK